MTTQSTVNISMQLNDFKQLRKVIADTYEALKKRDSEYKALPEYVNGFSKLNCVKKVLPNLCGNNHLYYLSKNDGAFREFVESEINNDKFVHITRLLVYLSLDTHHKTVCRRVNEKHESLIGELKHNFPHLFEECKKIKEKYAKS